MSENIKITGIALNINDKNIYITLDEARELSKQLSEFLDKKDDKEDKIVYIPYIPPWEVTYNFIGSSAGNPDKYCVHNLSELTYEPISKYTGT